VEEIAENPITMSIIRSNTFLWTGWEKDWREEVAMSSLQERRGGRQCQRKKRQQKTSNELPANLNGFLKSVLEKRKRHRSPKFTGERSEVERSNTMVRIKWDSLALSDLRSGTGKEGLGGKGGGGGIVCRYLSETKVGRGPETWETEGQNEKYHGRVELVYLSGQNRVERGRRNSRAGKKKKKKLGLNLKFASRVEKVSRVGGRLASVEDHFPGGKKGKRGRTVNRGENNSCLKSTQGSIVMS